MTKAPSDSWKTLSTIEKDIHSIHKIIGKRIESLNELSKGIKESWSERATLDFFLDTLEIEKNEETRYIAYERVAKLREDSLLNFISKSEFSKEEKNIILAKAFRFVQEFHDQLHHSLIEDIEKWGLLTPFYRKLTLWVHAVWKAFHRFHDTWNERLIHWVNERLESRFWSKEAVMNYLTKNNLFDAWHGWEIADRSYSLLQEDGDEYKKLSYKNAFPQEIGAIIEKLHELKESLQNETDEVYGQKEAYFLYFDALISAFSETDTDNLVTQWAKVDEAWMTIHTPFQIVHPLEYYEDIYRKAVAPEWDFRLKNSDLFESVVQDDIQNMFERFLTEKDIAKDSPVARFSHQGLSKVQLYISSPMMYYGSQLGWLPSAQVVPNDAEVSKTHGKKIFSFPENVLARYRSQPQMKISKLTLSDTIRAKRKEILFGSDSRFYRLYDIETIGHEFWHTLWLDLDTEIHMNASWNFKNIEEWKATTGWLMAFFQNPENNYKEDVLVDLITRSVGLISWMKQDEVVPYYTEWLIHLKLLFDSKIIYLDEQNRVELRYSEETFESLREIYEDHYGKLIDVYISKSDASKFLDEYTIREGWYFLPKDEVLRGFVKSYYHLYEEIWSVIDDE